MTADLLQQRRQAPPPIRVAVLMTCHDRKDLTLRCLTALDAQRPEHVSFTAFLVDDGSTDGTAEAAAALPWVRVIRGDGQLFWCRGMHLAFSEASKEGFDHYLWLNDDTRLRPDAIARLLACEASLRARTTAPVLVVGSTVDPATQALTYGGARRLSRWRPLAFETVVPRDAPQPCDTLNGNVVLVPADAADRIGNLDPRFEHAMGDTEYGLRARARGVEVWVAPGIHGECARNRFEGTYHDRTLGFVDRWRRLLGRKGLPWRSWYAITSAHAGALWPLVFAWPYIKFLGRTLVRR